MLTVEHIDVFRGKTHVLRDVSLRVERAEIVALIGANGAGKTTTLQTMPQKYMSRHGVMPSLPMRHKSLPWQHC